MIQHVVWSLIQEKRSKEEARKEKKDVHWTSVVELCFIQSHSKLRVRKLDAVKEVSLRQYTLSYDQLAFPMEPVILQSIYC